MEEVAAAAIVDARGTVTGWTEGARRLTGYAAEEVVGRAAQDLLAEDVSPPVLTALTGTVVLRHRDGGSFPLRVSAYPVLGADGEPQGFVVTTTPEAAESLVVALAYQQAPVAMSVYDTQLRFLRANDRAAELLEAEADTLAGQRFADLLSEDDESGWRFNRSLRQVVETGRPVHYENHTRPSTQHHEHAWTIDMWPVQDAAGEVTAVAAAAVDETEQYSARRRLMLLNEAAVAIGTTLDVPRTAEELLEVVVPPFADFASVDLLGWVLGQDERPTERDDPVMRRIAHRSVTEGTPEAAVRLGDEDIYLPHSPPARALRECRAVLRRAGEADFDRWVQERNARDVGDPAARNGAHSLMAVPLMARDTILGVAVFVRIRNPDPYVADDTVFAEELVSRAAVCIDNARRFARERSTTLALQHSLLPRALPGPVGLEVAHRYVPSGSTAGFGGDWFDVIQLSGSRVALVVGDVVGHGIGSTATMGRLRTAVRTLADVDLAPDELLTHLDDLVSHLASEGAGGEVAELGATCLYAIYDPVSRRLDLAAAGHPAPAVLQPDGSAHLVTMSAGPPLGVGGLPFECLRLELPEGSLIALYTNGLIRGHRRDLDCGTNALCHALEVPKDSLDTLCDAVLKAVLPDEPGDDVALLLARTRALGADRVATWDVPTDPAYVATARQNAVDRLAEWGLEEAAFVTELVVSELVTNAIRYGGSPIRLRLIRDRSLICEVFDGSSTSPHLRRAHAFDEGGRGLLLVAQLTQRWGSRQTDQGKTIWAEQTLPD
ncbi:SpoIIE family protein phosphatase [Streptomyces sp. NPDC004012]